MTTEKRNPRSGHNAMTVALSMLTGLGLTLMAVALGVGVIQGESADGDAIGLWFMAGLLLLMLNLFNNL